MRLTKANKLELARFGCTFLQRENLICIPWDKERQQQINSTRLVTHLFCPPAPSGPLLSNRYCVPPRYIGRRLTIKVRRALGARHR
jgi:hypothetical protein